MALQYEPRLLQSLKQADDINSYEFTLAEGRNYNLTNCLDYPASMYKFANIGNNHNSVGKRIKERLLACFIESI